jgi:hypothetical protein
MRGASKTIAVVMPVRDDLRRDAAPGVDEGAELTEYLAAAHLHRADLGDGIRRAGALLGRPAAGGLQVHDDERDLAQQEVAGAVRIAAAGQADPVGPEEVEAEAQLAHAPTVGNRTDIRRWRAGRHARRACRWAPIPCGQDRSEGRRHGTT